MFLFKPYVHLDRDAAGDYELYIAVALQDGFKLGAPIIKVNTETLTREITLPLEKQHSKVYYAPTEVVISISNDDKNASRETSIEVKVGNNNDPDSALQLKGSTKILYIDQEVSTRSGKGSNDYDPWDADS